MNDLGRKISVTIATYKRDDFLRKMLEVLANQTIQRHEYEIIICDSENSDQTRRLISEVRAEFSDLDIRHILSPNILAAKRNAGIREAKYDIVIFLDDDCMVGQDYLERHRKYFSSDRYGMGARTIFCGEVRFPSEWVSKSNYYRFRDAEGFYFEKSPDIELDFRTIVVMNMSFLRSEFVEAVGRVNESFVGYGMEDQELGWRITKAGFKVIGIDARVVHYENSQGIRGYGKKIFHTARDGATTLLREAPDAFRSIKILKAIDRDYPHRSLVEAYFYRLIRFVIFRKLLLTLACKAADYIEYKPRLYSKRLYRYILACFYALGVLERDRVKASEFDWYK